MAVNLLEWTGKTGLIGLSAECSAIKIFFDGKTYGRNQSFLRTLRPAYPVRRKILRLANQLPDVQTIVSCPATWGCDCAYCTATATRRTRADDTPPPKAGLCCGSKDLGSGTQDGCSGSLESLCRCHLECAFLSHLWGNHSRSQCRRTRPHKRSKSKQSVVLYQPLLFSGFRWRILFCQPTRRKRFEWNHRHPISK